MNIEILESAPNSQQNESLKVGDEVFVFNWFIDMMYLLFNTKVITKVVINNEAIPAYIFIFLENFRNICRFEFSSYLIKI